MIFVTLEQADRAEKRLRKSMSCGNDCGLRRGLIQNGGLLAGKKQPEFKMKNKDAVKKIIISFKFLKRNNIFPKI